MTRIPPFTDKIAEELAFLIETGFQRPAYSYVDHVRELNGWFLQRASGSWLRNKGSLNQDYRVTSSQLGEALRRELVGPVAALDSVADALFREDKPTDAQYGRGSTAALDVLAAIATPECGRAAWVDLINAVLVPSARSDLVEVRVATLKSVVEAFGHDPSTVRSLIARVLRDSARAVVEAHARLDAAHVDRWPDPRELAGLSAVARMQLCERVVGAPSRTGVCVAWIANWGWLEQIRQESGRITFWEGEWAIPNVTNNEGQQFPGRDELRLVGSLPNVSERREERQVILARVELGHRMVAGASQAARSLLQATTDVAAFGNGRPWTSAGWECLLVDGAPYSITEFITPDEQRVWGDRMGDDRTAARLASLGAGATAGLSDSGLPDLLQEAMRTWNEAATSGIRSQLIHFQRIIELVASWAASSHTTLRKLLVARWPFISWRTTAVNAIFSALDAAPAVAAADAEVLRRQIRGTVSAGLTFTTDLSVAANRAHDLLLFADGDPRRRAVAEVLATLVDSEAMLRALNVGSETAATLDRRSRRVRNALTHGNPLSEAAAVSIGEFSEFLASSALGLALYAYSSDTDLISYLHADRDRRSVQISRLMAGETLREILAQR